MEKAKYPGWRTMTGAQRRNARMDAIFDDAYERAARAAGWAPNGPHGKWVLAGDTHFSQGSYMPTENACRYICVDHDLLAAPAKKESADVSNPAN